MSGKPYEDHGTGDRTALPAALGLGLPAAGGRLPATARPWHRPGRPPACAGRRRVGDGAGGA
ncbi:hypothetical protein ACFWUZ_23165 [Streptomyces sp. NPDC058646]|uniref:hypothetical protein n=1 Tax=Streptomyces sp. NPDC058646 TaxID=3346574 RepID=UPI00365D965D